MAAVEAGTHPGLLPALLAAMEAEARRAPFPVDAEGYAAAGRDPRVPIACAGSPCALICSFGRDLGRDEVRWAQPQVGAAGRLVRRGVLEARGEAPVRGDPRLEAALRGVFLSNTVPYKPPGNRAYPESVKERFRPMVAALLAGWWQGTAVLTLGTAAFRWFSPYLPAGAADAFWRREDRYEAEQSCRLEAEWEGERLAREVVLCPLPHPSPLNRRWVGRFPELLRARLERWAI